MTPSPQGTTPSQAPVMSREEWDKRLSEIEARCNGATPGPWVLNKRGHVGRGQFGTDPVLIDGEGFNPLYELPREAPKDNGTFVANARQDLPDLLAYARTLQAEVERLGKGVKHERNVNAVLMAAGNALGNIAYNGAQSERIPEDYRKSMKEAVADWDKAREKARQPNV